LAAGAAQAEPVLVSTARMAQLISGPEVVVVDMAADPLQYTRFHLPGAVYLPYERLVRAGTDGVSLHLPDGELAMLLGGLGIDARTYVVAYDDMGGLQAARLFWDLERIGHRRVSVLDGGLVAWIREGRPLSAVASVPRPTRYELPARGRDNVATLTDVLRPGPSAVVDVRSAEEYTGAVREAGRGGHVPGAKWWHWERAIDLDDAFRVRPPGRLSASLKDAGLDDAERDVILYCRSGHRAAHSYLVLRSLGRQGVRVYDGSMAEYARKPQTALRSGSAP